MNKDQNQPMVVQANEAGREAITSVCDLALKLGGLRVNLPFVDQLLTSVKPIPPQSVVSKEVEAKFEEPKIVPIRPKEEVE